MSWSASKSLQLERWWIWPLPFLSLSLSFSLSLFRFGSPCDDAADAFKNGRGVENGAIFSIRRPAITYHFMRRHTHTHTHIQTVAKPSESNAASAEPASGSKSTRRNFRKHSPKGKFNQDCIGSGNVTNIPPKMESKRKRERKKERKKERKRKKKRFVVEMCVEH